MQQITIPTHTCVYAHGTGVFSHALLRRFVVSVCLAGCLPLYLSVCLSACLPVCLSVCLSILLSVPLYVLGSVHLSDLAYVSLCSIPCLTCVLLSHDHVLSQAALTTPVWPHHQQTRAPPHRRQQVKGLHTCTQRLVDLLTVLALDLRVSDTHIHTHTHRHSHTGTSVRHHVSLRAPWCTIRWNDATRLSFFVPSMLYTSGGLVGQHVAPSHYVTYLAGKQGSCA